jgi:hypothetical protein
MYILKCYLYVFDIRDTFLTKSYVQHYMHIYVAVILVGTGTLAYQSYFTVFDRSSCSPSCMLINHILLSTQLQLCVEESDLFKVKSIRVITYECAAQHYSSGNAWRSPVFSLKYIFLSHNRVTSGDLTEILPLSCNLFLMEICTDCQPEQPPPPTASLHVYSRNPSFRWKSSDTYFCYASRTSNTWNNAAKVIKNRTTPLCVQKVPRLTKHELYVSLMY